MRDPEPAKPDYVMNLEAIFGPHSDRGFGSAVFYEKLEDSEDLEHLALRVYRHFVGGLWARWGEAAWGTAG